MELITYDKTSKTSVIKITDEELVDIKSVIWGVLSTFNKQDPTILGIDKSRLKLIEEKVGNIISERNKKNPSHNL